MPIYDKGSAVLTEVETKKYTAFGDYAYFDPSTSTITITDVSNTEKVSDVALTKSETGKYYHIAQTLVGWAKGLYEIKIKISDGVNDDITIYKDAFTLK